MNVLETSGLAKAYRGIWALRDCTVAVPAGRVAALVGPNGAGKTTLLNCAVGLCQATAGNISVLGDLEAGSLDALERVAFVAQDAPLYRHLSVAAMLAVTGEMNPRFDNKQATERLSSLEIPLHRKVSKLSGGQQAQLSLTLALGREPDLLVLLLPRRLGARALRRLPDRAGARASADGRGHRRSHRRPRRAERTVGAGRSRRRAIPRPADP